MKKPDEEKGHGGIGLLVALALLGGVVYAASRLLRGRCPFVGSRVGGGTAQEESATSYVTLGDGRLGEAQPQEEVGEEAADSWLAEEATTWLAEEPLEAVEEPGGDSAGAGDEPGAEQYVALRSYDLIEIEGIGPAYSEQLAALGLKTTEDLLHAGASPKGREDLAVATGISGKLILRWVNQADLFRVKGVGEQYADLLEAAGVDTVPELAQRRAGNLTKRMGEVNEEKGLVRRLPTENQVAGWIEIAKTLPREVTY